MVVLSRAPHFKIYTAQGAFCFGIGFRHPFTEFDPDACRWYMRHSADEMINWISAERICCCPESCRL